LLLFNIIVSTYLVSFEIVIAQVGVDLALQGEGINVSSCSCQLNKIWINFICGKALKIFMWWSMYGGAEMVLLKVIGFSHHG